MPSISYPIKMIRTTALSLLFLVSSTTAFAPAPSSRSMQRSHQFAQYMSASPLEVVDETNTSIDDAFKNYQCTDGQTTIATKDTKVGSGYTIGDSDSQLLQMKYTCRFLDSKFTANIKAFDVSNMVFQTGEQRILPGLEEGIQGMKVGGTRLVKVPPSRGYGDKWFRGKSSSNVWYSMLRCLYAQCLEPI